jgi:hypothetical protein
MMEAVSTSEMSVNFYETMQRNIPEDSRPPIQTSSQQFTEPLLKIMKAL